MAEYKTSNTDTIVKIILVFFISLLSFSIGTFVGKKFSDNQHKLSAMEPTKNDEKTAAIAGTTTHGNQEEALSDDQVAALANEFVDDEATHGDAAKHEEGKAKPEAKGEHKTEAATPHEAAKSHEAEAVSADAEAPAAKEAAKHEAPKHEVAKPEAAKHEAAKPEVAKHETVPHEATQQEANEALDKALKKVSRHNNANEVKDEKETKADELSRIPSNVAKEKAAAGTAKYTIQVAAYPSETEAQRKVDDLKKLNFEAFFRPAMIKGQTWFRVNIGTYVTAKEAQEHKSEIIEKAHINSVLVQQLTQ